MFFGRLFKNSAGTTQEKDKADAYMKVREGLSFTCNAASGGISTVC